MFESSSASSDGSGSGAGRVGNATDSRFFWMALYVQPCLWVALAVVAIVRLSNPIWLSLVGESLACSFRCASLGVRRRPLGWWGRKRASGGSGLGWGYVWLWEEGLADSMAGGGGVVIALVLTITNTLAFSRCDKFSQAENLASSAMYSGGLARNIAGGLVSRFFRR